MKRAFVFPGQGSQAPGMGQALAEAFAPARDLFDEIDEALSQRLSRLMFEGPEGELMLTENAQPALLAASLAVVRVLESDGFDVGRHAAYVAGHSLGEYSALAAAIAVPLIVTGCGSTSQCPKPVAYDDATLREIQKALTALPRDSILHQVMEDYETERDDLRFCK